MRGYSLLLGIIFIGFSFPAIAQISAVSSNSLNAYNAQTIGDKVLEIEPQFYHYRSFGFFDNSGDYQDVFGVNIDTYAGLRTTFGITENVEVATFATNNFDLLNAEFKINVIGNESYNLGVVGGALINLTNGTALVSDRQTNYLFGIVSDFTISENIWANATIAFNTESDDEKDNVRSIGLDLGYKITNEIEGMVGLGHAGTSGRISDKESLNTLYTGVGYTKERYALIVFASFDIGGRNAQATRGFVFSAGHILQ